jgi:small conductance mechanosensitive channel
MVDGSPLAFFGGAAVFVGISLFVLILIIRSISGIAKRSQLPKSSVRDLQEGIVTIWAALVAVWILQSLGLTSIFSSLTLSGIIGLGITLALQSTLSNLFCGFWLLSGNVLRIGDIIQFGDVKGAVIKLSLRTTWLKTSEGNIAIISNSNLYNGPFINFTAAERLSKKLNNDEQP